MWMGSQGARGCSRWWCTRHGWGTVGIKLGATGASHRSQVFPFECTYLTVVAINRWRVQTDYTEIINNLQMQSVAPVRWCASPFQQNPCKEWLTAPSALLFLALLFNNLSMTSSCEVIHLFFFCV